MKALHFLLAAGFTLSGVRLTAGDSLGTQVTVDNARQQPLRFTADAVTIGDAQRFTLTAQRGPNEERPEIAGRLMVFDGQTPIVNCQLGSDPSEGAAGYTFLVSERFFESSILTIVVTGENKLDLPEGERYWFYLKDLKEMASVPAKTQPVR